MLKIYGTTQSRALRSIWAAEEIGVPYELVPTSFSTGAKTPEYLAINPNGRVPALVDGELKLFESMAINLYLAKTYGKGLYPQKPADEARALQWSIWGITELEPHLIQMLMNKMILPKEQRSADAVKAAEKALERPLKVLDAQLRGRKHLLGDVFTIADLNVASVLSLASLVGYDVSGFAEARRWLDACTARPSLARAQKAGA